MVHLDVPFHTIVTKALSDERVDDASCRDLQLDLDLADLPVEDAWSAFLACGHRIRRGLLDWELD